MSLRSGLALLMVALVATQLLVTVLPSRSAVAQATSDDPALGDIVTVDYLSEPEFLLVAGEERWTVRNRPQGTLASGFGHPKGTVDEGMVVTGRHEELATLSDDAAAIVASDRQVIDISYRNPTPYFEFDLTDPLTFGNEPTTLEHAWAFARYDDGTAEVWGPVETGLRQRYVLDPRRVAPEAGSPLPRIVGGGVAADRRTNVIDPDSAEPVAIVVLEDGRLVRFDGETPTVLTHRVAPSGTGAVAAVAREATVYTTEPPGQIFEDGFRWGARYAAPAADAIIMVLTGAGELLPIHLQPEVNNATETQTLYSVRDPLSMFCEHPLEDDPVTPEPEPDCAGTDRGRQLRLSSSVEPLVDTGTTVDFDYSCAQVLLFEQPVGALSFRVGAGALPGEGAAGCHAGQGGRLSVAVGVVGTDQDARQVYAYTAADAFALAQAGSAPSTEVVHNELVCTTDYLHPGTFDVQVAVGTTSIGCVTSIVDDPEPPRLDLHLYQQPGSRSFVDAGYFGFPNSSRDASRHSQRFFPQSTVLVDPLTQVSAGATSFLPETETLVYTAIEQPTLQLQLPCWELLGRSVTGSSGTQPLASCYADPFKPEQSEPGTPEYRMRPQYFEAFTVAGYGTVGGNRRLFVGTVPARQERTQPSDETVFDVERGGFTIEPQPYRTKDFRAYRAAPPEQPIDPTTLDAFDVDDDLGPNLPVPLLAQVPRPHRVPFSFRLESGPTTRIVDGVPLAILQAPPTVEGLGQQTDDTPRFSQSRTEADGTTSARSTSAGTHVEIEGTMSGGFETFGVGAHIGGGAGLEMSYMNEVEEAYAREVSITTTESYGGAFDDHTIVTQATRERVWSGRVIEDPSGFGAGEVLDYGVPIGEIVQSIPLSQLESDLPNLYGPEGLYRPSLDRIIGGIRIGDPGSYRAGAASGENPTSLLAGNGGPCTGGFAGHDERTPYEAIPTVVDPANRSLVEPDLDARGSSIVVSLPHAVSVGNGLQEGASIEITDEHERSAVATRSSEYSISAILTGDFKFIGTKAEFEVKTGLDFAWSDSQGIVQSLGEGTTMEALLGNVPLSPSSVGDWVGSEGYDWQMFLCKAPIGPLALGQTIFVLGYLVDGYNGSGGVRDLSEVVPTAPINSQVVLADPTATPSNTVLVDQCSATPAANEFRFEHPAGTVRRYRLEYENLTSGGQTDRIVDLALDEGFNFDNPKVFNDNYLLGPDDLRLVRARPDCAVLLPGDFTDGALYRWRTVVEGYVGNEVQSDWEFFRPQVWPPDYTIDVRAPVVNADGSVTLDVEDPEGVTSLLHEVVVHRVNPDGTQSEALRRQGVGSHYRTPTLDPGSYEARVAGYNSHVLADGSRAQTPPDAVQFVVPERLEARFDVACQNDPCLTTEVVSFTDESLNFVGSDIVSWQWDFGDGSVSSEQNPTHVYGELPADGDTAYQVTLEVVDADGRVSTANDQVLVAESGFDRPTAAWTVPGCDLGTEPMTACALTGAEVTFDPSQSSAPAGEVVTWLWDFGDGTSRAVLNPDEVVIHSYERPGEKVVQLWVKDQLGQISEPSARTILIGNRPAVATLTSDTSLLAFDDEPATFSVTVEDPDGDPAAATVRWEFPDSDPAAATGETVTHTWTTPGTKTVRVTVIDEAGGVSTATYEVQVLAGAQAGFTWACAGRCRWLNPVSFFDLSTDEGSTILSWHWSFGDGTTSTAQHPTHYYWGIGTFPVTLTVTDLRGDRSTITRAVRITLL